MEHECIGWYKVHAVSVQTQRNIQSLVKGEGIDTLASGQAGLSNLETLARCSQLAQWHLCCTRTCKTHKALTVPTIHRTKVTGFGAATDCC